MLNYSYINSLYPPASLSARNVLIVVANIHILYYIYKEIFTRQSLTRIQSLTAYKY